MQNNTLKNTINTVNIASNNGDENSLVLGCDSSEAIKNINATPHHIGSIKSLVHQLKIADIPIVMEQNGEKYKSTLEVLINPIQDLLCQDIIDNSEKAHNLSLLNINFLVGHNSISRDMCLQLLEMNPAIKDALIVMYYRIFKSIEPWLQSHEKLLAQRRTTSTEIYKNLERQFPAEDPSHFTPEKYNLITADILGALGPAAGIKVPDSYFDDLKRINQIGAQTKGFDGAAKLQLFLEMQAINKKEIIEGMLNPIQHGSSKIAIDTKFLYMDNGHHLYKAILKDSYYNDYFNKEIALIKNCIQQLDQYVHGKYIGLGVGSGEKDYELINNTTQHTYNILIDGSIPSLQEAEVLFTGNKNAVRGLKPKTCDAVFSQDWIDVLAHEGTLKGMATTFGHPHTMHYTIHDIRERHNIFSMLGGTFGNFSHGYKNTFLKDMSNIMNSGDHLLLSVFNIPESDKINDAIKHYSSPQTTAFVKNFFIKLGVDPANIDVSYYYEDGAIHIDATIAPTTSGISLKIYGETATINQKTTFSCFTSQRMSGDMMTSYVSNFKESLFIKDIITEPGNPFTFYVISKY